MTRREYDEERRGIRKFTEKRWHWQRSSLLRDKELAKEFSTTAKTLGIKGMRYPPGHVK